MRHPRLCRLLVGVTMLMIAGCGNEAPQVALDADTLLARGAEEAGRFSWDTAAVAFADAEKAAAAGSLQRTKATYGRAVVAHQRTPASAATIAEAETLYRQVVADTPTSSEAGLATYGLGQIAAASDYFEDDEDLPKARELFSKTVDGWAGQEAGSLAALALADAWAATLKPEDMRHGCELLEAWLAKYPADPYAVVDWQWLGNTWQVGLGDSAKAVACFREADKLGLVPNGRQHEILWRIARMAERDLGDKQLAAEYYRRLIIERPSSGKGWEAQQRLIALGEQPPELKLYDEGAVKRALAAAQAKDAAEPAPPKKEATP